MKKVLLMAVAVAFLATSAFAQAAQKPVAVKPAPKVAPAIKATGTIVKANATNLTLKTKTKEESFVINADTRITQGTKAITATDLKAGENATVTYTKTGETMTATKIVVATAKPAAGKKDGKPVEKKK